MLIHRAPIIVVGGVAVLFPHFRDLVCTVVNTIVLVHVLFSLSPAVFTRRGFGLFLVYILIPNSLQTLFALQNANQFSFV
jgi:hypothetical protein